MQRILVFIATCIYICILPLRHAGCFFFRYISFETNGIPLTIDVKWTSLKSNKLTCIFVLEWFCHSLFVQYISESTICKIKIQIRNECQKKFNWIIKLLYCRNWQLISHKIYVKLKKDHHTFRNYFFPSVWCLNILEQTRVKLPRIVNS